MKKAFALAAAAAVFFAGAGAASAHVIVKPASAGVGSYQTFDMGVPVEKDVPTVGVRLLVPAGVESVTPNAKPGWTITVTKDGTGEGAQATEIDWTGGSIPAGERDDFLFSAKVPAQAATLQWKAYQTYRNGSVVAWDRPPAAEAGGTDAGPYSTTQVVDDLSAPPASGSARSAWAVGIALAALALSALSLARSRRA